jgi:hypothetical protein
MLPYVILGRKVTDASVAPASTFHASAMLLVVIMGKWKEYCVGVSSSGIMFTQNFVKTWQKPMCWESYTDIMAL